MRKRKQLALILLTSGALLGLLTIQVFWTFRAAKTREDQFNQRVAMVLSRTSEELCRNKNLCTSFGSCCLNKNAGECRLELSTGQKAMVDSMLRHFMYVYKIELDYSFEIIRTDTLASGPGRSAKNMFRQDLESMNLPGDFQLRVHLPEYSQYVLAEMGPVFIVSVLLILLLLTVFVMTLRTLAREKAVLQRTTDFVNNMTHELKTPLANISLAASMIGREDISAEKKAKYNAIIRDENERLKAQVERLLSLASLERGTLPMEKLPVDMKSLAAELVLCMEERFAAAGGKITLHDEAARFTVTGDRLLLNNALANLLENALKYSGSAPTAEIRMTNQGNWLQITVADQGPGIPEKEQALIFEPFYRISTGDVHDVKGFGLGLPFVKKIAEIHGGSVSLKSAPGKGSRFILQLPLA